MLSRHISLSKQYDLMMVAYHEAGHAIYALLHGMKVDKIHIYEDKKCDRIEGITHYTTLHEEEFGRNNLINKLLIAEVGVKYAGLIAEKEHFKNISGSEKFPSFLKDGSSSDTISAALLIKRYNLAEPGKKRYQFKKRIINSVSKELQNHWNVVTMVAHHLFAKKKLLYPTLRNLLVCKSNDRDFWKKRIKIAEDLFNSKKS